MTGSVAHHEQIVFDFVLEREVHGLDALERLRVSS